MAASKPVPTLPTPHSFAIHFVGENKLAKIVRPRGLKADDAAEQFDAVFDLDPRVRSPSRQITAIQALGNDAFQTLRGRLAK